MAYDLIARLKLEDGMSGKLRNIENSTNRMQRAVDSANSSVGRMKTEATGAHRAFSALGSAGRSTLSGIGTAARGTIGAVTSLKGALLAAGTAYAAVINPLKLSSDAEQAGIAFETMLGSADKAQKFLGDLTQFANKTPFELPGLRDSAKKMLAFQFAASDVIPTLTAVGNAASGLGLGADGIDRITIALGQMKAKGRVQGDEILQLTEAGIPALDILAKKMKISTAEVMKLSEKGLIPADTAIKTLIAGMNERFPDMMDKQSKSISGLWSTIKDTFNNSIFKKWGDGLAATLKPRFDSLAKWINNNGATIDKWGKGLQTVANEASDAFLRKFEGAFRYLKNNIFENPEYKKLTTFESKVNFAFDSFKKTFDTWYNAGGSTEIANATNSLIGFVSDALSGSSSQLSSIGVDLGKAIASGMLSGIQDFAKSNPMLSTVLTFAMTPGPWPVKLAAAGIVLGTTTVDNAVDAADSYWQKKHDATYNALKALDDKAANTPAGQPMFPDAQLLDPSKVKLSSKPSRKAGGLSRVPYNNFPAYLDKDERVLTSAENNAYSSGKSGGHTFQFGNIVVQGGGSTKETAAAIMSEIVRQANEAFRGGALAGE